MKLIGITGKAGTGKTTFSDYLAQNKKDIGVIHIDDLLDKIKLKYFKPIMRKNNKGKKLKVDLRLKSFIYKNKYIFNAFVRFRSKLIAPLLNKELESFSDKRIVIIDDIFIKSHKIYKDLGKIYILKRAYKDRKQAIMNRDGITKREVVAYDIAHNKGSYKEIKDDMRVEVIENDGNAEKLRKIAEEIYNKDLIAKREKMLKENIVKSKINNSKNCFRQTKRENLNKAIKEDDIIK